jgi:hypothetical protein
MTDQIAHLQPLALVAITKGILTVNNNKIPRGWNSDVSEHSLHEGLRNLTPSPDGHHHASVQEIGQNPGIVDHLVTFRPMDYANSTRTRNRPLWSIGMTPTGEGKEPQHDRSRSQNPIRIAAYMLIHSTYADKPGYLEDPAYQRSHEMAMEPLLAASGGRASGRIDRCAAASPGWSDAPE